MSRSARIPIAILLGGILLAGAVYFSMGGSLRNPIAKSSDPSLVRPVGTTDHIFGNPAAPATIVEYCDFDSPYCKDFSTALHELVASEGDGKTVAWVYREFPLSELFPDALALAQAAECAAMAGGNDAFWKFADALYAAQPADPSNLGVLASQAGITDTAAFASCYTDAAARVDARIKADRADALAIGADGAPYSLLLVAGQAPVVLDGAYPYDALKAVVDQALAGTPQSAN